MMCCTLELGFQLRTKRPRLTPRRSAPLHSIPFGWKLKAVFLRRRFSINCFKSRFLGSMLPEKGGKRYLSLLFIRNYAWHDQISRLCCGFGAQIHSVVRLTSTASVSSWSRHVIVFVKSFFSPPLQLAHLGWIDGWMEWRPMELKADLERYQRIIILSSDSILNEYEVWWLAGSCVSNKDSICVLVVSISVYYSKRWALWLSQCLIM